VIIRLVKIGKPSRREIISLVEDYEKRLRAMARVEFLEFKDVPSQASGGGKGGRKDVPSIIRDLRKGPGDIVVCLDERGKQWTSPELAGFLNASQDNREVKSVSFVVGGPYGLGDEGRRESDQLWCLSKGVYPSEIAWLVAVEQIYRAINILHGTPYHHE
jgi:23S rRNA (pseudouridine1915-N3)-methyltransferase